MEEGQIIEKIVDALSILIGFILSFIGIQQTRNARKEIATNRVKMEEERIVGKLVNYLNNTYLTFCFAVFEIGDDNQFHSGGGEIPGVNYNIFEVGYLADFGDTGFDSENDSDTTMMHRTKYEFDTAIVMFDEGVNELINIGQFVNNPYMPNVVADELSEFVAMFRREVEFPIEQVRGRYEVVLVRPYNNERQFNMKKAVSVQGDAYKTWSSFKGHSKSLTDAIRKWYADNHIKTINIRIDFSHTGE